MEDIRLDEETVLKTAGADTASGFESLVFRLESCKRLGVSGKQMQELTPHTLVLIAFL